jgi:meiotic recombination protein DMC1
MKLKFFTVFSIIEVHVAFVHMTGSEDTADEDYSSSNDASPQRKKQAKGKIGKQAKSKSKKSDQALAHENEITNGSEDTTKNMSENEFVDIDKLQDGGINVADLKKLKESGIHSAMAVIYTTRKDLCNIKGMSDTKVEKIQEVARKLTDAGFVTGSEYLKKKLSQRLHITTGASQVDRLLGGGIESSSITELFGEFRCGKTQICHTLSVTCQLPPSQGGGGGKALYIDTENTFRPDRIETIATAYGLDPKKVLDNVMCARCLNSDHLWQLLVCASAKMAETKFALLVIDSLMAPFRVDYSGRGELSERQQFLGRFMVKLQKMSEEFNIAVVITNQVMSDPGAAMSFAANPPKPIGGHVMAHFSTTRLALRKGRGEQRVMKIYDSPCLPEGDAVYEICAKGIQDSRDC